MLDAHASGKRTFHRPDKAHRAWKRHCQQTSIACAASRALHPVQQSATTTHKNATKSHDQQLKDSHGASVCACLVCAAHLEALIEHEQLADAVRARGLPNLAPAELQVR